MIQFISNFLHYESNSENTFKVHAFDVDTNDRFKAN